MQKGHVMAADHSTDRDAFGHWLSGFTDGEGCFYLGMHSYKGKKCYSGPTTNFHIILRQDDAPILEKIRQFWGVGRLYIGFAKQTPNQKPQSGLVIGRAGDLASVVIPHFERYPLRAKKASDFEIWKQGVALANAVRRRKQRGPGSHKWTAGEAEQFRLIMVRLREQRQFEATDQALALPAIEPLNLQPLLDFM
jgi:hypothetical protein